MEYTFTQEEDLALWSRNFVHQLDQKKHANIVTFSGDLGTGKTTSIQKIAQALGIPTAITSPTFVIQKEYEVTGHDWIKKLIHIDAYRLKDKSELEYLGWEELITHPEHLVCIEWPSQVAGIALPDALDISLKINPDHSRTMQVTE